MKKKVSNNMYKKIKKSLIEYIISNRLFMSYVLISVISMVLVRKNTVGIFKSPFPFLTDLGIILVVGAIGYFIKPQKQYKYFFILSPVRVTLSNSPFFSSLIMAHIASRVQLPSALNFLSRCACEREGVACSVSIASIKMSCSSDFR